MCVYDSSVGRATDYVLGTQDLIATGKDFSLIPRVQTGPCDHPNHNLIDIALSCQRKKRSGREANHSSAASAKVKNGGPTSPFPHTKTGCST